MMSISILKLTENEIMNTKIVSGQVLYSTDTKDVYYDHIDSTRMITTSIIPLSTELAKENYIITEPNKAYLVLSTSKLYIYAGEWIEITEINELTEILFDTATLVPIIMNENGVDVAPATVASNVYTEDGNTVESILSYLSNIASINASKTKIEVKDVNVKAESLRVEIPFPFENYIENGNSVIIFLDGKYFNTNYYSISENYVMINDSVYTIQNDCNMTFLFMYSETDLIKETYINGIRVTPYSIPTNRLQCTTNKIDMNSDLYIPTTKALHTLQQEVNSLCKNGVPVVTTKMAMTTTYVTAIAERQVKFEIPFPFENYLNYGNSFLLFDGSLFIDDRRYHIIKDSITNIDCVILDDTEIVRGNQLTFVFMYNTSSGNGCLNPDNTKVYENTYFRFREIGINRQENYTDITYGNGLFVAISDSNSNERIMTSTDGEQWEPCVMDIDVDWTAICHGNDTFVAVGISNVNSNCVAISNNGKEWTSIPAASNSSAWIDICYGNNTFVAIAESSVLQNKTIMVSVDKGNTWITSRCPITERLRKVVFGNNRFVILSSSSILVSSNTINWSVINKKITDICYKEGRFFYIIDDNGKSKFGYTIDFIEFVESDLADTHHAVKIYNGGDYIYIFCDNTGSSNDIIVTDGFNLSDNLIINSDYEYNKFNFAYGNGLLVGLKPENPVSIVTGKLFFPELANLYYKN